MFEDYLFTKNTKWILWGLFALIVALLIFRAGVVIGFHEALQFHGLENRNGPQGPFGLPIPPEGGMPGYGAVGTIASITLPDLILTTRDGAQLSIYVASDTPVKDNSPAMSGASELKVGETIVVIGDPNDTDNDGDMDARFIHIVQ